MANKIHFQNEKKNKVTDVSKLGMKVLYDLHKMLMESIANNKTITEALSFFRKRTGAEYLHIIELNQENNGIYYGRCLYVSNEADSRKIHKNHRIWHEFQNSHVKLLSEREIIKPKADEINSWCEIGENKKFMIEAHNGIVLPLMFSDRLFGFLRLINLENIECDDMFMCNAAMSFATTFEHIRALQINEEQIELLAEAKKEAEDASEVKSRFLANMSHEIRTPMNAVIGMAEIAMREDLPKKAEESILQIKASGEHLLSIINDILDFSKLESGKLEIIEDNYRILALLNDVENIIQPRMRKSKLEFHVELDPKIPEVLWGDEKRIRQILLNFINNSIKFTKEGSVTLRVIVLERQTDDIVVRFEVEDTGTGIREEDLERLFKAFEQADKIQHKNIEGTGLGLAISKFLVQLMNGRIGVKSTYGQGSVFFIELSQKIINALPCGEYRYLAPVDRKDEQVCFVAPKVKILLVDDTEMNIVVAKGIMEPYHMQMDVAYDGVEALEKLEAGNRYDFYGSYDA